MAGHSQFKNIMHRKGRQDAQRSRLFGKLAREITVAAKLGAPDPAMNARLRAAVLAARAENMTKDTIERAIKKSAAGEGAGFEEIRYEGYGPGGVAVIVQCLTDNRNRTAGEVRSIFAKAGGNLGETGSVAFQFDHLGRVAFARAVGSEDAVMEAAIEAGAEDAVAGEAEHEVYCAADDLAAVSRALEARFGEPRASALAWRARVTVPVDEDGAMSVLGLVERLEDNDDVQSVTTNADVPDAVLARLAGD